MRRSELIKTFGLSLFISSILLGWTPFSSKTLAPVNLLASYLGFQTAEIPAPVGNVNHFKSDVVDSILPQLRVLKEEYRSGNWTRWNPYSAGGENSFSNSTLGQFSPRMLPYFLLENDSLGLSLSVVLFHVLAWLGAYLFAREFVDFWWAQFVGLAFAFCGFNVSWGLALAVTNTSLMIPWFLWAILRLSRNPTIGGALVVAFAGAFMILGGFPSVAAYAFYFGAAITLWRGFRLWRSQGAWLRFLVLCLMGTLGSFVLSGFQLVPLMDSLADADLSHRVAGWLEIKYVWLLFSPFDLGIPHPEFAGYTGVLTIVAGLVLLPTFLVRYCWKKARTPETSEALFFGVSLIVLFACIYGEPRFLTNILTKLPVLNFNPNSRMLALWGLALPLFVALLLGKVWMLKAKWLRALPIAFFVLTALDLIRITRANYPKADPRSYYPVTESLAYVREHIRPGQSVIGTSDLYMVSGTLGHYRLQEWYAHALRSRAQIDLLNEAVRDHRQSWTASSYLFEDINFASKWHAVLGTRFVITALNRDKAPASDAAVRAGWIRRMEDAHSSVYERASTGPGALLIRFNKGFEPTPDALAKITEDDFSVRETGVELRSFETESREYSVQSEDGEWLVISARKFPGWKLRVNGEIVPTFALRTVIATAPLEAGAHEITWTYEPERVQLAEGISLSSSLLGLGAWIALALRRRRNSSTRVLKV